MKTTTSTDRASSKQVKSTHKESSVSTSKINHGSDKGKTAATSTSKGINGILPNNKGRQSAEKIGIKRTIWF